MNDWLYVLLIISTGVLILSGIRRRSAVYEFGFLFGWAFAGFVVLQIAGVKTDPLIPVDGLTITLIMGILSVWLVLWGQTAARSAGPISIDWAFHDRFLLIGAIILAGVGSYFMILVREYAPLQTERQWSGPITIYIFMARCLIYALIIASIVYLRTGSVVALAIIGLVFLLQFDRLFIGARRADLIEMALIPALAVWFNRRIALPRILVIGAIALMTILINSVGEYRGLVSQVGPVEAMKQVRWIDNSRQIYSVGGAEVENAVYQLSAVNRQASFDFGAFHWNVLVSSYVPGQILGINFKEDLMFEFDDLAYSEYRYEGVPGSTSSGLSDAFSSFWYFGAFIFFGISFFMTRLFESGTRGNVLAQIFYMTCITAALHSVTHHTGLFYISLINAIIFMGPFLILARRGNKDNMRFGLLGRVENRQ